MPLLLLFIVIPVIEIYLLIQVGSVIGAIPTILLILLTAVIGTALLRQQGLSTMRRYQQSVQEGRVPAQEMVEGLALLFGGVLLLTPGFFTDAIGFLCLLPFTRRRMIQFVLSKVNFRAVSMGAGGFSARGQSRPADDRTFEGEYTKADDDEDDSSGRFPPR